MGSQKRLLLVEDNPVLRQALERSLEERGWCVVTAGSGEEALALWPEAAPDAVVTDYRMGQIDGLTLARRLRSKIRIPVVLCTAELTSDLEEEAEALDVIPIRKGDLDALMSALDRLRETQ